MKFVSAFVFTLALLATPAFADFGLKPFVTVDNPDIPNCTVMSQPPGCENVLRSADTVTSNGTASCPCPWEVFTNEHCVK